MKAKRILHTICKEQQKGYKHVYKVCRRLIKVLKEYFRQKYGQKERSFYPSSVTVDDKMTLEKIKKEYFESEVCMGEMLLSLPATGLSLEEAFELNIQAKKWADGDKFYRVIEDEVPEEL